MSIIQGREKAKQITREVTAAPAQNASSQHRNIKGPKGKSHRPEEQINMEKGTSMAENSPCTTGIEDRESSCSPFKLIHCDNCSTSFSSQTNFDMHLEFCRNNSQDVYNCSGCNVTFKSEEELNGHIICHDIMEHFTCKKCNSIFQQRSQFENHPCIKKIINLTCNMCGCKFSQLSSLKNHMKIHSYIPGRDFIVPTFCETILSNDSGLANDNQTFTPLMPQLDIPNSGDASSWSGNLSLNDSLENKDISESIDISQEMAVLDSQSAFESDFENIEVSAHSEILELKHQIDSHSEVNFEDEENPTTSQIRDPKNIVTSYSIQNEIKIKPHTCRFCGVSFTREKALISHERFHQDYLNDILECKKCGEIFLNKKELRMHTCSKVAQKLLMNEYHSTLQDIPRDSQISQMDHLDLLTFEPENIEYPPEHYGYTMDPAAPKLKQNKHTCEHCFKRFSTKQKKFRHMWIHRNKTFSCEICAESFTTQKQLNEHRLSSHGGNTPHGCVICGKCFASRQGLWEHMKLHKEGSAPHQCKLCGKKFASRQGYYIHARTHTGERPYGCRYCWKAFRDGGTLRKHERIHTGERPHVCPLCHRAFNQKVVLREHVRWLHAHHQPEINQPFIPCPIPNCRQTLTDKEDLCAHIVKHSDILPSTDTSKPNFKPKSNTKLVKKEIYTKNVTCENSVYSGEDASMEASGYRCEMCGESFPARELLLSHIKIHI